MVIAHAAQLDWTLQYNPNSNSSKLKNFGSKLTLPNIITKSLNEVNPLTLNHSEIK